MSRVPAFIAAGLATFPLLAAEIAVERPDARGWPDLELRCVANAAAAAGFDYDYPTLMAASGRAFRIQVLDYQPWCPSCFAGDYGFDPSAALTQTIPTLVKITAAEDDDLVARIDASLEAGVPVPAKGPWWWGILTARETEAGGETRWTLVTDRGRRRTAESPTEAWILAAPPEGYRMAIARTVLERASTLDRTAEQPGPREGSIYAGGNAAWLRWYALLERGPDGFAELYPSHDEDGGLGECYRRNYGWLAAARRSAAAYCGGLEDHVPRYARRHVAAAADSWRELAMALADAEGSLPPKKGDWSAEARARQTEAITTAANLEAAAIHSLRKALAAWEE